MSASIQELFNISDQLAKNLEIPHKLAVPKMTKIVVNAPYGDGRSFAFLVPEFFQMNDHPHLWKCVLFQNQSTNTFSLAPTINSQQIKNLKTSLMSQPNKVLSRSEDSQLIAEHLCTAYVGLILRYLNNLPK